ncbi:cobalt ABC transporter ATP-binding protein, partial [Streptomyces sp. H27-D2]|nr:cobalt ABC transporter ATP-binding protein [Streptomyces sp. H27-D2]
VSSPAFAPQVAKILAPLPWLTVPQVARALGVAPTSGPAYAPGEPAGGVRPAEEPAATTEGPDGTTGAAGDTGAPA